MEILVQITTPDYAISFAFKIAYGKGDMAFRSRYQLIQINIETLGLKQ